MSDLVTAVAEKLAREQVGRQDVEQVLRGARVTLAAAAPTPVRLRVERVAFQGTKRFEDGTATTGASTGTTAELVPIDFSWELGPGVYAVGSHENLRGKTSVLEIIRWALRGRCGLTATVRSWLEHVTVVFAVGNERLVVDFAVEGEHSVRGTVFHEGAAGTPLASFDDEDSFEHAMGSVMMPRLQLQPVTSWVDREEQVTVHGWPAYAGALSVSSGGLGALLGDVAQAGLPTRLLSMFVGAAWVATRSEVVTALGEVDSRRRKLQQQVTQDQEADEERRAEAEAAVTAAQEELDGLPSVDGRLEQTSDALATVARLSAEDAELQIRLGDARAAQRQAEGELREEQARRHALAEDALARRFFNALEPTACPRCAAPVTAERKAQEAKEHACSVCSSDLDDVTLAGDVLVAKVAPQEERAAAARAAAGGEADDAEDPGDALAALEAAAAAASAEVERLTANLATVRAQRRTAAEAAGGDDISGLVRQRRDAELALARAQGASAALGPRPDRAVQQELAALDRRRKVLKAADQVTKRWVQDEQKEVLELISDDIVDLAAEFRIEHLTSAKLAGSATLTLRQGGADTSYSKVSDGEKLRLKVATAVALLRRGFDRGIGRHPGLVTVDSLGSEEMAPEDFDAMVGALVAVTANSQEMQVIIATRNAEMLESLLPEERRRIAPRGGYLW